MNLIDYKTKYTNLLTRLFHIHLNFATNLHHELGIDKALYVHLYQNVDIFENCPTIISSNGIRYLYNDILDVYGIFSKTLSDEKISVQELLSLESEFSLTVDQFGIMLEIDSSD